MTFQPVYAPKGVYLRTTTGELIGRLDEPGEPFGTLAEAQSKAKWLEAALQFQNGRALRGTAELDRRPFSPQRT